MTIDNKATEIASFLYRKLGDLHHCYEEIDAYGAPSECIKDAWKSVRKTVATYLNKIGMTAEQVEELLVSRTSERWFYFSGFSEILFD